MHTFIKMTLFFALIDYHPKISYKYNINKHLANELADNNIMKYKKILVFLKKKLDIDKEC